MNKRTKIQAVLTKSQNFIINNPILLGIVALFVYFLAKGGADSILMSAEEKAEEKAKDNPSSQTITRTNNTGIKTTIIPSITRAIAKKYADDLYSAMNRYGTDTKAIQQIFAIINPADLLMIHTEFGVKSYDSISGSYGWLWSTHNTDLAQMLKLELGWGDAGLNEIIRGKYKAIGIIY